MAGIAEKPDAAVLLAVARAAAAKAISPYSKLRVGAAVLSVKGSVFAGCNIENPSFAATLCAERSAIAALVTSEGKKSEIASIAIWCDRENPCYPCGICRQALVPFSNEKTLLILEDKEGSPIEMRLADLLPHAFTGF
jgi:cytidine deaminase